MRMSWHTRVKVSAGNSGQQLTLDTQHISAMNKSFGLKLEVVKHLPLGYLQTKNELTALSHCDAEYRRKNLAKLRIQAGIYQFHCLS